MLSRRGRWPVGLSTFAHLSPSVSPRPVLHGSDCVWRAQILSCQEEWKTESRSVSSATLVSPLLTGPAMMIQYIERKLFEKSKAHRAELKKLGQSSEDDPLSKTVLILAQNSQLRGMNTIIQDMDTSAEDFIFYFDRLATLLVEQCVHERWSSDLNPSANNTKCHEQRLLPRDDCRDSGWD